MSDGAPHLVHVFPSFEVGGVAIRVTAIINHLADRYRHTIISLSGCTDARARLDAAAQVSFLAAPAPRNPLTRLAQARRRLRDLRPDAVLSYNWGSVEWMMANSLFPVAPHIHLESGFGADEAVDQIRRRVLARRLLLAKAARLVVPSATLKEIAARDWRVAAGKIAYIPNGVDLDRFRPAGPAAFSARDPHCVTVCSLSPLRPEKNVARLLRAIGPARERAPVKLVLAGDGPERASLERLAGALGIAAHVSFLGQVDRVERLLQECDIFALSSDTEQMPNSLLQAAGAALPVAGMDVGDVRRMMGEENAALLAPKDDEAALAGLLVKLVGNPPLCRALGAQNRRHAMRHFAIEGMLKSYEALFDDITRRRYRRDRAVLLGEGSWRRRGC